MTPPAKNMKSAPGCAHAMTRATGGLSAAMGTRQQPCEPSSGWDTGDAECEKDEGRELDRHVARSDKQAQRRDAEEQIGAHADCDE